jgi:hypothetical protein
MAQKTSFVSPGVYSFETDLSQLPKAAAQIGGAFIGLTNKGPAFLNIPVSNFGDFRARFGDLNKEMYLPYAVRSYLQSAPVANIVRVLGKGNPNNAFLVDLGRAFVFAFPSAGGINSTAASSYTANLSAIETIAVLRSRQTAGVDIISNVSYTGTAAAFTADIGGVIYSNLSLDRTAKNYIKNIFGTDPKAAYNGDSATGIYVDAVLDYRFSNFTGSYTGSAYGSSNNPASASVTGIRYISGGYKTGSTPMIVSQPYLSGTSVTNYNLFRLISRTDGEASNMDVKVIIQDVETTTVSTKVAPKFTIQIRAFDDTDSRPQILESFRVDLNPDSDFFISRVIGDRYQIVQINEPAGVPETVFEGENPNKSNFVRVELQNGYKFDSRPMGFLGPKGINPFIATLPNGQYAYENDIPIKVDHLNDAGFKSNNVFPGFDFEGTNAVGFVDRLKGDFSSVDGTLGSRGFLILGTTAESTIYTPSLATAYNASLTSQFTLMDVTVTGSTSVITDAIYFAVPFYGGHDGIPSSVSFLKAINDGTLSAEFLSAMNVIANPREVDINLLCVPGVHTGAGAYNGSFVSKAIDMCENRGDTFYLADIGKTLDPTATNITTDAMTTSIADATNAILGLDSNYAGVYYPWIRIYDNDSNRLVWVPPTTSVVGAYAYNDKIAKPWYAVGGFNRGQLDSVVEVRRRLTQTQSDTLYVGRVNPIVSIVNQGIVIFGQKTLQKDDSALNRINVRRLLLYLKKVIAGIANQKALFEFNNARGRQTLKNAIVPILEKVQVQNGIEKFQVIIDESNNTPDVIDRNELRGTILVQPTKVAEIVILNYVITRTGANFAEVVQSLNN